MYYAGFIHRRHLTIFNQLRHFKSHNLQFVGNITNVLKLFITNLPSGQSPIPRIRVKNPNASRCTLHVCTTGAMLNHCSEKFGIIRVTYVRHLHSQTTRKPKYVAIDFYMIDMIAAYQFLQQTCFHVTKASIRPASVFRFHAIH